MVIELALVVGGVLEELFEFSNKAVGLAQIKRTEVGKERFIY